MVESIHAGKAYILLYCSAFKTEIIIKTNVGNVECISQHERGLKTSFVI